MSSNLRYQADEKWILSEKDDVYLKLVNKVEPPFRKFAMREGGSQCEVSEKLISLAGTSFFQMEQDVLLLTDELLAPTLPAEEKEVEGKKAGAPPEPEKKA